MTSMRHPLARHGLTYVKALVRTYAKRSELGKPADPFNFYVLDADPLVIFTITPVSLTNAFYMARELGERPAHFVVGFTWDVSRPSKFVRLGREYRRFRKAHGATKHLSFVCNSEPEVAALRGEGLPAILVNKSVFLDLSIYRPLSIPKAYDAILNSRMGRYKRLELAREVESLAVLTVPDEADYLQEMRATLRHAAWLNFSDATYRRLPWDEVAEAVNRARVGLILSKAEGNCLASLEYLLCGVPVVSTPSRGGRDVFYREPYALVVEDRPEAVREGVRELIRRDLDPALIRARTLEEIDAHRARFGAHLNEIRAAAGAAPKPAEAWFGSWRNKLKFFCAPASFLPLVNSDYFTRDPLFSNETKARAYYPDLFPA